MTLLHSPHYNCGAVTKHTQLQLSLHCMPAQPVATRTCQPSPVVLHRPLDKLAVASRLAKRYVADLKTQGKLLQGCPTPQHLTLSGPVSTQETLQHQELASEEIRQQQEVQQQEVQQQEVVCTVMAETLASLQQQVKSLQSAVHQSKAPQKRATVRPHLPPDLALLLYQLTRDQQQKKQENIQRSESNREQRPTKKQTAHHPLHRSTPALRQSAPDNKHKKKARNHPLQSVKENFTQPQSLNKESTPSQPTKHPLPSQPPKCPLIPSQPPKHLLVPSQPPKRPLMPSQPPSRPLTPSQPPKHLLMPSQPPKRPLTQTMHCCTDGLYQRLCELEAETEQIRDKWRTVTFDDPLPTVAPATPRRSNAPVCHDLSPDRMARINTGLKRYSHYLELTGTSTKGGFDPWAVTERLADEVLSELMSTVTGEVEALTNSSINTLYNREFRPPTHT